MNCREAKRHIALWVGDDLEPAACTALQDHLSVCLVCRRYARHFRKAFRLLQHRVAVDERQRPESLWPDLLNKLPAQPGRRPARFNGWWAALAVGVAWIALVSFWQNESRRLRSSEEEELKRLSAATSAPPSFRNVTGRTVTDSGRFSVIPVTQPFQQSAENWWTVPSGAEMTPHDPVQAVFSLFERSSAPPAHPSETSAELLKSPFAIPWKTSGE